MKTKLIFAWYDLWIGVFIDKPKRIIYVFPLPMIGFKITLKRNEYDTPRDNIITRIRLWRICRAIGIKRLYEWQRDFIFDRAGMIQGGRATGKTLACIIKLLMWRRGQFNRYSYPGAMLKDPDYSKCRNWADKQVFKAHAACKAKGIRVFELI